IIRAITLFIQSDTFNSFLDGFDSWGKLLRALPIFQSAFAIKDLFKSISDASSEFVEKEAAKQKEAQEKAAKRSEAFVIRLQKAGKLTQGDPTQFLNVQGVLMEGEELKNANIRDNEYEELSQKFELLSHGEQTLHTIKEVTAQLYENEPNIYNNISQIIQKLKNISIYLPKANEYLTILENIEIEIKEIAISLTEQAESMDFSAEELQRIENRLDLLQKLMFKHHVSTTDELLNLQNSLKNEINSIDDLAKNIDIKEADLSNMASELNKLGENLFNVRQSKIPLLENKVKNLLSRLGMQESEFVVQLDFINDFTNYGMDKLLLKFSANKGIAPEPIEKVASGGELSRLMLALKSIIAAQNYLPTLIFDEIDMGVSGNIAAQMAELLSEMSMNHQVIVITHLPQIAAKAKYHIFVEKKTDTSTTRSVFKYLSNEERIMSIASMLSSENILDTAIDTAKQLLNQS
ncbi:MAG TPA: hypothetical protein PLK51_07695, partial [Bacteroidales bacterium]|nr:hypothetical protein [Bacteroidales bacterium]